MQRLHNSLVMAVLLVFGTAQAAPVICPNCKDISFLLDGSSNLLQTVPIALDIVNTLDSLMPTAIYDGVAFGDFAVRYATFLDQLDAIPYRDFYLLPLPGQLSGVSWTQANWWAGLQEIIQGSFVVDVCDRPECQNVLIIIANSVPNAPGDMGYELASEALKHLMDCDPWLKVIGVEIGSAIPFFREHLPPNCIYDSTIFPPGGVSAGMTLPPPLDTFYDAVCVLHEDMPPTDICHECVNRRNQKDLYPDPTDCQYFWHCVFDGFAPQGVREKCMDGYFFSPESLNCVPTVLTLPVSAPLPSNPQCLDICWEPTKNSVDGFTMPGDPCNQFWVCSNKVAYQQCCQKGTRYDSSKDECLVDKSCQDNCTVLMNDITTIPPTNISTNSCIVFDSLGKPTTLFDGPDGSFFADVNMELVQMFCPDNMTFNVFLCRCEGQGSLAMPPLERDCWAYFPFDTSFQDTSAQGFWSFPYDGAVLDTSLPGGNLGGAVLLTKPGANVEFPGYKTIDLGKSASWCILFYCGADQCGDGTIMSNWNGQGGGDAEGHIRFETRSVATARYDLRTDEPLGTTILTRNPILANDWNQMCMTKSQFGVVSVFLNGSPAASFGVNGKVMVTDCPLTLGLEEGQPVLPAGVYLDELLICRHTLSMSDMAAHKAYQGQTLV